MSTSLARQIRPHTDLLSTWAIAGGGSGLVASIGPLPSAVKAILLVAFVFAGPGSALLQYWSGRVPRIAQRALVPVLGLAVVFLILSVSLLLGYWQQRVLLLAMAAVTLGLGLINRQRFDVRSHSR